MFFRDDLSLVKACCRLATGATDAVGALVSKQQLCLIAVVLTIAWVSCDSADSVMAAAGAVLRPYAVLKWT